MGDEHVAHKNAHRPAATFHRPRGDKIKLILLLLTFLSHAID
jgi:hypothetical protein